jgi:hypothetical protein
MRTRTIIVRWIGSLACALAVSTGAQASTIDVGLVSVGVSGPGTVTGALGPAGLNVNQTGDYLFNVDFSNTTGTAGSSVNALSFFDVFVEFDADGTTTPCGGTGTLLGGSDLSCSALLNLATGDHVVAPLLDLTLAANPFGLTDGSTFEAQDASAGGAPTPLTKDSNGLSKGAKIVIVAVVVGGGAGAAIALAGKRKEATVPEPGTLALVGAGVVALAFCRIRVSRRSRG